MLVHFQVNPGVVHLSWRCKKDQTVYCGGEQKVENNVGKPNSFVWKKMTYSNKILVKIVDANTLFKLETQ